MALLMLVCFLVVSSHCATLKRNPKESASTTLRLTAQRNDTGSWTTKFGDYQMTIEHKHFQQPKADDKEDGTWTLKVKHTSTVFEDKPEVNEPRSDIDTILDILSHYNNNETESPGFDIGSTTQTTTEEPFIQGVQVNQEPATSANNAQHVFTDEEPLLQEETSYLQENSLLDEENPLLSENEPEILQSNYLPLRAEEETEVNTDVEDPQEGVTVVDSQEVIVPVADPEEGIVPDVHQMTDEEREHFLATEENRVIMERYPRSRSLGDDFRKDELESMGYKKYPEVGWVKLHTAHWQWDQARNSCQVEGGHLAIPDTLLKIRTFTRILKNNTDVIGRAVLKNQVFVGVHDPNNNRRFTTVKGEPFVAESVSIWFPNEPNDAHPGEDCITLHLEGKLRDVPCFFNLPFLCQID